LVKHCKKQGNAPGNFFFASAWLPPHPERALTWAGWGLSWHTIFPVAFQHTPRAWWDAGYEKAEADALTPDPGWSGRVGCSPTHGSAPPLRLCLGVTLEAPTVSRQLSWKQVFFLVCQGIRGVFFSWVWVTHGVGLARRILDHPKQFPWGSLATSGRNYPTPENLDLTDLLLLTTPFSRQRQTCRVKNQRSWPP